MKLLFICTANLQRSPTAEHIFKDEYETKSAGIDSLAKVVVSKVALDWADIVFVMESWHKEEIKRRFPKIKKRIISLNIPDEFYYMDPELVKILKEKVRKYL